MQRNELLDKQLINHLQNNLENHSNFATVIFASPICDGFDIHIIGSIKLYGSID